MSARGNFFLGAVVGTALGALGTHLVGASRTTERLDVADGGRNERTVEPASGPMLEGNRARERTFGTPAPTAPAQPGDLQLGQETFLRAYRATFRQRAGSDPTPEQERAAWAEMRSAAAGMPTGLGAQAADAVVESRRRAEITERDDIMAVLNDSKRASDVAALRNDPENFHRLVAHKVAPTTVDGRSATTRTEEAPLPDGTRLLFPDGVFVVGEDMLMGKGRAACPGTSPSKAPAWTGRW